MEKDILGKTDFNFDISIRLGSGAYVCGEETALIESLEGHRGEPQKQTTISQLTQVILEDQLL
ncbi:MAG: hypothetical protein MZV64_51390 [Ignavibacteriales bacterium]|nr:hypothetical protein [Ignavibacteriales bacterium]